MEDLIHSEMTAELLRLRTLLVVDFVGLATNSGSGGEYSWTHFSGGKNRRSGAMTFRGGRGIAGEAIRIGRPLIYDWESGPGQYGRNDCPLMLAEGLIAAAAVPASGPEDWRCALVVGARHVHTFSDDDIRELACGAKRLALQSASNARRMKGRIE